MNIKFDKEIYNDGYLADKYSKYCEGIDKIDGIPYVNFPFHVEEIPDEHKYLSWTLIDHDSNPVVNFSWIHWLVANYEIDDTKTVIPERVYENKTNLVRGNNTFSCPLTNIQNEKIYLCYGGPTPPDKDHEYTLVVYAHDEKLDVSNGFFYNDLLKSIKKVNAVAAVAKLLART